MAERTGDRLYALLPGHIRARDHEEGRPLQALMRILARELAVVEGDIDALYDNWFIETCEDWAVPYIGDLVGARPLRPFGEGGGSLRAYVANTVAYRQAKGTVAVVEQLARDATGWPARAVEFFRVLIQNQNVNHIRPGNLGTVSLGEADAASRTGGPFGTAAHLVGVRPIESGEGRYNIPNLGVFLWRLQSAYLPLVFDQPDGYLGGVQPPASALGAAFLHLDPLRRDLELFNRGHTEATLAHLATEADLPGPLRRRPLFDELEALRGGAPGGDAYFADQPVLTVRLDGQTLPAAKLRCCNLEDRDDGQGGIVWRQPREAGEVMFDPVLGRLSLHPDDAGKPLEAAFALGMPHDIGGGPYDRQGSVGAWIGPLLDSAAPVPLWQIGVSARAEELSDDEELGEVVATLAEAIVRWNTRAAQNSRGIIAIMDSASYLDDLTGAEHTIRIPAGARLAVVAAGWPEEDLGGGAARRLPGALTPQDRRPHLGSGLVAVGDAPAGEGPGALILDGLLIEGSVTVAEGRLGSLELRHSTAGAAAGGLGPGLSVQSGAGGRNTQLSVLIDHAISGALDLGAAAATLSICDSVIAEDLSANPDPDTVPKVVAAGDADLVVQRATIFGRIEGRTLEADDTIFVGPPDIARRQDGCVRFSYVPAGARTPRRYRCTPDLQFALERERLGRELSPAETARLRARIRPVFTSSAHGHPAFGQLALTCPQEIAQGAERDGEMGAMNALGNPARVANLRDALDEYLPFGLAAGFIFMT
jgi:hypothetical protein